MALALEQARAARDADEVPIGAVIVRDGEVTEESVADDVWDDTLHAWFGMRSPG